MYRLRCRDLDGPEWDCPIDFVAHASTKEELESQMLSHCGSQHAEQFVNLTDERLTAMISNMLSRVEEEASAVE